MQNRATTQPVNQSRRPFGRFADQWAVRLTTYKRDGTPVGTPVNIVVEGDRAYFRTYEQSWKFKRLRRNPEVAVAPSTVGGKPTGPEVQARAHLLEGPEDERAGRLIDAKHRLFQGILVRLAHRIRRFTTRHFELRPETS